MVGFKMKEIESFSLGEVLKKARGERGVDLKTVSEETKVQMKYLEFLENSKYDKLPVDVYAKGFLKQYGNYLGMDVEKLTLLYNKERSISLNIKNKGQKIVVEPIKEKTFVITPKIIFFSFLGIIMAVIFLYLWFQVRSLINPPILDIISPIEDMIVSSDTIAINGKTDQYTEVLLNGKIVDINEEGVFSVEYFLQKGLNIIEIRAKNKLKKETIITKKIIKE